MSLIVLKHLSTLCKFTKKNIIAKSIMNDILDIYIFLFFIINRL